MRMMMNGKNSKASRLVRGTICARMGSGTLSKERVNKSRKLMIANGRQAVVRRAMGGAPE